MNRFPIPFTGATQQYVAGSKSHLRWALGVLLNCGHDHNFLVQLDGLALYCSPLASQCLREAYQPFITDQLAESSRVERALDG